jgi:hypothetical protein
MAITETRKVLPNGKIQGIRDDGKVSVVAWEFDPSKFDPVKFEKERQRFGALLAKKTSDGTA